MANWNENLDLIHGDSLLLYLTSGKTVVAYATSCSLQVDAETIDTSSKFSCKWSSNMGGKAGYQISADALYSSNASGISFDSLLEMMVKGEQVEWYMGEEQAWTGSCETNPHTLDTSKTYYNGKAVVTSCSLEAGNNEIASCSITMTGAGEIQKNGAQISGD
jgi:hypothetical protein